MWNLPEPVDDLDLIDAVNARTQPSVYAEDLIIDHHRQGQKIEHIGEVMPNIGIAVLAITFCVEPVRLGDTAGFMVAADEVDAVRVAEFEADEEGNGFD